MPPYTKKQTGRHYIYATSIASSINRSTCVCNDSQGVWVPPNENVKLPVAIKVLNEGSSMTESRELLDEARIMASVVHPYCLRVVAVCMTAQLMLVVPLMPLGSLLDYVRKNRANIDSKTMLNWATQIARVSPLV